MTDIGHIAANHSVWDLEPDYLSAEALLLIYADFRVKQLRGEDGREITRISTLAEAFQVILAGPCAAMTRRPARRSRRP